MAIRRFPPTAPILILSFLLGSVFTTLISQHINVTPVKCFEAPLWRTLLSEQGRKEKKANDSLYGEYCDSQVQGEKQAWNKHKKIISFSAFAPVGTNPNDIQQVPDWVKDGMRIQAVTAKRYYPDWVVRFYAVDLSPDFIQEMIQYDNVEVVKCIRHKSSARNMLHRFLAVDDPSVMLTMVRDADSRFTLRELMAVNEFLGSNNHLFHSMRDHPQHVVPVMGCSFDMKRGLFDQYNNTMTGLVHEALEAHKRGIPGCCGEDQSFLERYVWPLVKNTTMDHDLLPKRCKRYGAKTCREYPLGPWNEQEYYFVGAPFKENTDFVSSLTGHKCTLDCKVTSE